MSLDDSIDPRWVIWTGHLGILAAMLVGIGEFTCRFSPLVFFSGSTLVAWKT